MSTDLKVLRVKKFPLYDVFQGEGWENWSRVLMKGTKAVLIAGSHLSISQLRSLTHTIALQSNQQQPTTD
jgi:hypothetical protein